MSETLPPQPANTSFTPGWSAFSTDWFTPRIPPWERIIKPELVGRKLRWLELGSYEGRSAIWTADNILTHPESTIDCVDIWVGEYEKRFDANIEAHPRKEMFRKFKCSCEFFLCNSVRQMPHLKHMDVVPYDAVYVDADHQAKSALRDAALAWQLLRTGGYMIFDDYLWEHPKSDPDRAVKLGPKKGIDAFLECWQYELRVLHKEWQVIIQKIS